MLLLMIMEKIYVCNVTRGKILFHLIMIEVSDSAYTFVYVYHTGGLKTIKYRTFRKNY